MNPATLPTRSDALVFFGATGDLAYKQIFPALQAMARHGRLDMPVIGVAKAGWNLEQLKERAKNSVTEHGGLDAAAFEKLMSVLRYVDGDYNDPATFEALKLELEGRSHPAHYLAIPPVMFPVVVEHLKASGCAEGARVIVEKPFGHDLASAQALNATLLSVFDEQNIFRIDHYLGKEAVQNLVVFRFANAFLEPIWNMEFIESIQITMSEKFGVQGRGAFYDQTGTVRDVVQNHLLQVVGILAMEPTETTHHDAIRDALAAVLAQVKPIDPATLVRGQVHGYLAEPGVAPASETETFAALRLEIDSARWTGVPFFIRSGKQLPTSATEVVVRLRQPPIEKLSAGLGNCFRFLLSPEIVISIEAQVKIPGEKMHAGPAQLTFLHHSTPSEMTPYERLLGDAMDGDLTLFTCEPAVETAWRIVAPLLGKQPKPIVYQAGTWGPSEAESLTEDVGGWVAPAVPAK